MINVVLSEVTRSIQDYIDYLRSCVRTTDISLIDMHNRALSQEVMKQYGIQDEEQVLFILRKLEKDQHKEG